MAKVKRNYVQSTVVSWLNSKTYGELALSPRRVEVGSFCARGADPKWQDFARRYCSATKSGVLNGLFLIATLFTQAPTTGEAPARLVFEGAQTPHFATTPEYVELRSGRGRLRVAQVLSDFAMTCEFRILDEDASGELLLHGWARGHIRLRLPGGLRTLPKDLVEARGMTVGVQSLGAVAPSALNVWHRLDLRVAGREMTVSINGAEAGRYEIEPFAGYVSFATRKGSVQLRSIQPRPVSAGAVIPASVPRMSEPGLISPRVVREVKPDYKVQAMENKVEGIVDLEAIVEPDGRVGPVRVIRTLEPGLDQQAIDAVRQWRFTPGMRDGKPVPVLVSIELTFKIK